MKTFTKEPYKRSPQLVQCIGAENPSLCISDVNDSQITLTGYQAIAQHNQPRVCLFFSGECGNAGFSVAPSWRVSIKEDLSVRYDTEALHGSLCFIKAHLPIVLSACLCVLSPPGPCTPSGLRETLAFELLSGHFLLLENRERRREY